MSRLVFRDLAEADLDAVAALEAKVSDQPWSRQLFADELRVHHAERHWLVAEQRSPEPTILGFGGMMYALEDAHLMNVAVEPDRHRRGVGRRLVANLVLEAIDRGARNLTLEVRVSNTPAIALYRRFRMAPVGSRPGYYADGEDALILWAHDIDHSAYRALVAESLIS